MTYWSRVLPLPLLVVIIWILLPSSATGYGKGPKPASTNAPGELSCGGDECHTLNPINSGPGQLILAEFPAKYRPGESYRITVTLSQQGQKRWGFQTTTLDAHAQPAGEFILLSEKLTRLKSAPAEDGSERNYIEHTLDGSFMAASGPVSWNFLWRAPKEDRGPIYIYTAANAANFNKKPWGDFIYTRIDTIAAQ